MAANGAEFGRRLCQTMRAAGILEIVGDAPRVATSAVCMKIDPYLEAAQKIPAGETRSFRELAALAGRPAAARAAGRAIAACPLDEGRAWQRVVFADGSLSSDVERARVQLERLRREGARPREGESIARYAKRRRAEWILNWRARCIASIDDTRIHDWPADRVEAARNKDDALARGFRPIDTALSASRSERAPRREESSSSREARASGREPSSSVRGAHPSSRAPRSSRRDVHAADRDSDAIGADEARNVGRTRRASRSTDEPIRPRGSSKTASVRARQTSAAPRSKRPTSPPPADSSDAPGLRIQPRELCLEPPSREVAARLAAIDWDTVRGELRASGACTLRALLDRSRCESLRALFDAQDLFERSVDMAPRGYGVGTYRYFKEPLCEPAASIRATLYRELVALARTTRGAPPYPATLAAFFEQCRAVRQRRASSILLAYATGGVNHLHRDIYGKLWFPYQAVLVLSARESEFDGGELLLTTRDSGGREERRTLPLDQGDLCVFASRGFESSAPPPTDAKHAARRRSARILADGARPKTRWLEQMHGMTPVTRGERFALGIVLHLAE
jgi:alkylated DNA nucleotide flippase Atl1